jgi:hypothetical protein
LEIAWNATYDAFADADDELKWTLWLVKKHDSDNRWHPVSVLAMQTDANGQTTWPALVTETGKYAIVRRPRCDQTCGEEGSLDEWKCACNCDPGFFGEECQGTLQRRFSNFT